MQNICISGGVTKDLELKDGKNDAFVNFSLAVNQGFGDNQTVNYYQCVLYGYDAKRIVNAGVKKGSRLILNGKFTIEPYTTDDGTSRTAFKVNVSDWEFSNSSSNHKNDTQSAQQDFDVVPIPVDEVCLDSDELPW